MMKKNASFQKLPDHIQPGIRLLFVGINPGLRSAEVGHHYAGHTNRFWRLLFESGLISHPFTYHDDWRLPQWGYGLTNIVARPTASSQELSELDYRQGRKALLQKVLKFQPLLLVLLGVTVTKALLTLQFTKKKPSPQPSPLGLQNWLFGNVPVFVLPNPSGRNAHYSYQDMLTWFGQLNQLQRKMDDTFTLPDGA